jgi:hypothetical protein
MSGVELIAAERQRQVEREGWTPEHDDTHDDGELARAAACYADPHGFHDPLGAPGGWLGKRIPARWPWDWSYWKPGATRVRALVKAGALIAAEIDRLQRANDASE